MATHSYNHGAVTSMKGPAFEAVQITGLDSTPGAAAVATISDQCRSNFLSSVKHTATGVYTLQLNLPYPPALINCHASMSNANGTTDIRIPAYKSASYDAAAGTLVIFVMDDDDSGAPVLADGGATDELHVWMVFRRYTT